MSRTYKDKPWKHLNPDGQQYSYGSEPYEYEAEYVDYYTGETRTITRTRYLEVGGVCTKKKRHWQRRNWMTTPMHWIHDFMQVPQRAAGTQWEKKALKTPIEDLDILDTPSVSRKPHIYYW